MNDSKINLSTKQYERLGRVFLENYLSHGYATLPKREIDILVFHLISESKDIKNKDNYTIANKLRLTETRVKSLRLESSLKYELPNHQDIVKNIVIQLIEEVKKPEFNGESVSIGIENPAYKREFEYAIKRLGSHVEYGINREILTLKIVFLLELILKNTSDDEKALNKLARDSINDKKKLKSIMNNSLEFKDKIKVLG